jgi:hypothetical protein
MGQIDLNQSIVHGSRKMIRLQHHGKRRKFSRWGLKEARRKIINLTDLQVVPVVRSSPHSIHNQVFTVILQDHENIETKA